MDSERDLFSLIGRRLPRIEGPAKAIGRVQYTADMSLPGMLHGKVLRSSVPHARILAVDVSRAMRLPGVKAVITGQDTPKKRFGILPKSAADEYALAVDKVRFVGDAVAAVAAIDEDTAEEALRLIRVEYQELPAVFDPLEALQPGAPAIHDYEGVANNVSAEYNWEFGDVEKAFAQAYHVREETFVTQAQAHAPLEPHACLADYRPDGFLTLWTPAQIPFFLRRNVAKTMDMPESRVRIVKPCVGGGFGSKVDMFALQFSAAALSKLTGRPVRIEYSLEELLTATRHRHPYIVTLKMGVSSDGTFLAQHARVIADGGAYNSTGPLAIFLSGSILNIPYRIPTVKYEVKRVYTNKPVSGALRGHGSPQVHFAADCLIDTIAADLGIDPVEIRLKNALHPGDRTANGLDIESCAFAECVEAVAEQARWKERGSRLPYGRGIGIGCSGYLSGGNNMAHYTSTALVHIHTDGAVNLLTGAADIGQGAESVLAQILAEELGVGIEDIRVTAADTGVTPLDPGTFGSRVTVMAGNAVRAAARDARRQLFEVAAEMLECNADDLDARDRQIFVKGSPARRVVFAEVLRVRHNTDRGMPVVGKGTYRPPLTLFRTPGGNVSAGYSFGAQIAEVEVDVNTGHVRVLSVTNAHDCGLALNPMSVEGQLEGSIQMGLGYALTEGFQYDEGQALNPSYLDYRMPTSLEMPEVQVVHVNIPDPSGPFGAKESGEGTVAPTAPAVANAIYDAVGVRITSLPITPEKVLEAMQAAQSASKERP
ncbi:MAG: molybdopterin-dependent oxidoreductase [Chloroflexi bacterium]|nr:molybdopterin-dependent oxidoreductase [Chloroflexota bacterium]